MKPHELDALRDLAIENLASAKREQEQSKRYGLSRDDYYRRLFVASVQTQASPFSSAIERQAASLLEQLMLFALGNAYDGIESRIVEGTRALLSLTGTSISWLPMAPPETSLSLVPASLSPHALEEEATGGSDLLKAGRLLTTKEAAEVLRKKPNTLRTWSSTQKGPIEPVKVDRELRWRSDDIIELLQPKKGKSKSRG